MQLYAQHRPTGDGTHVLSLHHHNGTEIRRHSGRMSLKDAEKTLLDWGYNPAHGHHYAWNKDNTKKSTTRAPVVKT